MDICKTRDAPAVIGHDLVVRAPGHRHRCHQNIPRGRVHCPAQPDLANCTVRYYGPNEFAVNPADRFELGARGNQPSEFCRKRFNCWGQLAINDDPSAPASPGPGLARALTPAWFYEQQRAARQPKAGAAALSVSAELVWPELVEGDPMRLWGRLHGAAAGAAANWADGFQFTLQRVGVDGQRQTILTPNGFKPFLQPLLFSTAQLRLANPTLMREWLVTPAAAQLTPGTYALQIGWNGTGLIAPGSLPAGGLIAGSEIQFDVQPADNNTALGQRQRHLAWLADRPWLGFHQSPARNQRPARPRLHPGTVHRPGRLDPHQHHHLAGRHGHGRRWPGRSGRRPFLPGKLRGQGMVLYYLPANRAALPRFLPSILRPARNAKRQKGNAKGPCPLPGTAVVSPCRKNAEA